MDAVLLMVEKDLDDNMCVYVCTRACVDVN